MNNTDVFSVVNNIYYKLETPLKAVDVCFKSFFALNLHYPMECEQIWLFIQNYFYDIKLESDKNFVFIKTLMNDLNNM